MQVVSADSLPFRSYNWSIQGIRIWSHLLHTSDCKVGVVTIHFQDHILPHYHRDSRSPYLLCSRLEASLCGTDMQYNNIHFGMIFRCLVAGIAIAHAQLPFSLKTLSLFNTAVVIRTKDWSTFCTVSAWRSWYVNDFFSAHFSDLVLLCYMLLTVQYGTIAHSTAAANVAITWSTGTNLDQGSWSQGAKSSQCHQDGSSICFSILVTASSCSLQNYPQFIKLPSSHTWSAHQNITFWSTPQRDTHWSFCDKVSIVWNYDRDADIGLRAWEGWFPSEIRVVVF